jgi:hypothetical protein
VVGDVVTVWYGDEPAKLEGKVVAVKVPGQHLRVQLTSYGELGDSYDWFVGEEFDMRRINDLKDAQYDDFFWSPHGEEVADGRRRT